MRGPRREASLKEEPHDFFTKRDIESQRAEGAAFGSFVAEVLSHFDICIRLKCSPVNAEPAYVLRNTWAPSLFPVERSQSHTSYISDFGQPEAPMQLPELSRSAGELMRSGLAPSGLTGSNGIRVLIGSFEV